MFSYYLLGDIIYIYIYIYSYYILAERGDVYLVIACKLTEKMHSKLFTLADKGDIYLIITCSLTGLIYI